MNDFDEPVRFDTKIAILLRDDLAAWQRINATAFVASGIAAAAGELIGEPYQDADGTAYTAMFRQPTMVFEGTRTDLANAHNRAVNRGATIAVFTADLFSTGNDDANRAAVRAVPRTELDLVAIAVHGPRNSVDKIMKGARKHP